MSQFSGTWEEREKDPSMGPLDFFFNLGLGEYKDKYMGARWTATYDVNGDNWKISWITSLQDDPIPDYYITVGKEFYGKGPGGSDVKITLTVVSDCETREHVVTNVEDGKKREFIITRKVNGDVMDVKIEAKTPRATTMKGKMYRKK
ncbi:uncharacterized protein LOC134236319 [Saccostrea cucullata]|uniref:uncharacterized protein LOC134236319 n=1 Tax=Saccostrea cuccullata TaxID=36930 RepID=UPI002ED10EF1